MKKSAVGSVFALLLISAVVLPVFLSSYQWPGTARDHLELKGVEESGATNLVSAIYLGYRAYDTLGETIVLLVAVTGTIGILKKAGAVIEDRHSFALPGEMRRANYMRTHLLEAVTSKLGPIVLLFGFYVMLYGHLSPGGGFQGGVVVASGIVFLALGSSGNASSALIRQDILGRIEAVAFLMLLILSISGIFTGEGFLDNPLKHYSSLPAAFIIVLNIIIGLKVGAGIGVMCIIMLGKE
ncbi:MnhB domain-containing protein [Spirochaeta isovalerica]|uniref:Multicomponent Na+:H+ antiporter subunit B n=1 Tax=Spirochaeta isovalerica TaxID=150 RepID=A0A841RDF9_9SPIO|nr:MnhB domain-containing protein [Spirochaeta isovalerica]MBB6481421.1 multicomponent Na+:H+ antiporter subunit B [Spirochaeta isovalerica]